MFSIPYTFASEDESYITMPALRRFAKEKCKENFRTTADRPQMIDDIEKYANQSKEKEEEVLDWLDRVLVEGIKEIQIKYLDDTFPVDLLSDDAYIVGILSSILVDIIINIYARHTRKNYVSIDMKFCQIVTRVGGSKFI